MDENGGGGEGSAESNTEGILQEGILYYKRVYYITRGYTILQEGILYYKSVYYITRGYTILQEGILQRILVQTRH